MFPSFNFENYGKYEFNGGVKSIAKLYFKLFQVLGLEAKVEELKKIYRLTKHLKVHSVRT